MKNNKIPALFVILFCIGLQNIFADIPVTIEINNVNVNGGIIYGFVFYSERAYRNENADITFQVNPAASAVKHEITLPEGECVISIFQDMNGNGIFDSGLFRIPKEPVGITNYNGGTPGNFNRLKINISNNNRRIFIPLIIF
ncbi:MAG: DUF2141 domain-containing protein [Treponema sp.]|nr:DUF2141 domain-containing protein [Treponema sp.]